MYDMKIYENPEFGVVRTFEIEGTPYFSGKDVADALGYANPQKALRDHVDEDDKTVNESFTAACRKSHLSLKSERWLFEY